MTMHLQYRSGRRSNGSLWIGRIAELGRSAVVFIAVLTLFVFADTHAESIPDAGSILRDQQLRLPQPSRPRELPLSEEIKESRVSTADGVRVTVTSFTFSGYEGIATEEELQQLVGNENGQDLSFAQLRVIADIITAHLKKKGWFLARAMLPKQEVTSGNIEIVITQGRSDGTIRINRDKKTRVCSCLLRGLSHDVVSFGKPLNEKELERSVLLMNDLPGVRAKATLTQGSEPGTSKVNIAIAEGPILTGILWADNQGNRYTGVWRGNALASLNDPFGRGDQVTLLVTEASGLAQGRLGYIFPISCSGARGNIAYSSMRYELGGSLAPDNYTGQSHSVDGGFSYPLLRRRTNTVTTNFSVAWKSFDDSKSALDLHNKEVSSATLNLHGERFDTLFGGGNSNWDMGVTVGCFHEANPLTAADALLNKSEGGFTHVNLGLVRLQRLTERLNLNVSWSAQLSTGNLDSSEKFSLGGANGIRAYPGGEASGDEGALFNAELRYSLSVPARLGNVQLTGFYDAGQITLQKNQVAMPATATNRNTYRLQGAGIGLNYTFPGKGTLRCSWAHVLGDNPGRSAAGNNSDGTDSKSRLWLQAMLYFQ